MSDITEEFENISAFDRYSLIRSAFRRVVHWASYNFILTSRRQRRVRVFDLQLYVPPSVFHPGVFLTSRMFARFLRTLDLRGKRVVEIGTGSGILAISAAKAGASLVVALDINPKAVAAAIRNANDNNVGACFSARTSDLFSAVSRQEKFDVVISSPRSFEGEPLDMADRAWHAGPGYRDIRALFQQAQGHLDMGGIVYLLLSSDTNVKYPKQKAFEAGFDWDLVTRKSIVVESFLIFRLNKRTTRSHQFTETSAKERAVVATPSPSND